MTAPAVINIDIQTPRVFVPIHTEEAEDARYLGLHGGRGSGKSHQFAEKLVERCVSRVTRAMCIREHQISLQHSSKALIESKIRKMGYSDHFRILNSVIEVNNGGLIIFQGMKNHTSDSIKSFEGFDVAWFEEAQKASQRSLDLLRPTIRADRSQMWFSWNPFSEKDPVDKLLRKEKPKEAIVVEANWMDNPWFPKELMIDLLYDQRRDPDRYAHIWLGKYDKKTNRRVFTRWRIGEPDEFVRIKRRNSIRPYYGSDFGFSNDPTVLLEMFVDEEKRTIYITAEAYKIGCEIDQTPALFKTIPGCENWPITADSARPETISYLKRFGFPRIKGAKKGPDSVIEGIKFLKSYDIVIAPECTHTIDEFTLYSWKVDPLTDEVLPELEDDNNHVIDAARYAVERLRKAKIGAWG